MAYTIFDIANWFINKESMDQKKVQKLCYYTQAWSMALYNKPMINCTFEAWAHGPVCRELWEKLHEHTYYPIPKNTLKDEAIFITDTDALELIERVWETYKEFNGYQLEVLTHQESPWINARGDTPEFQKCTSIISQEDMRAYYRALYSGDGLGE